MNLHEAMSATHSNAENAGEMDLTELDILGFIVD